MKKRLFPLVSMAIFYLLIGCSYLNKGEKHIVYVAPMAQPHNSESFETLCLYIKWQAQQPEWELFCHEIKGFHYQPGRSYKLLIRVQKELYPESPNDSVRYHLVKIISETEKK